MSSGTAQIHSGYIYSLVPVSSKLHFLHFLSSSSRNVSCISSILSVAVVAILSRAL
jgi:hypothetical protein